MASSLGARSPNPYIALGRREAGLGDGGTFGASSERVFELIASAFSFRS